MSDTTDHLSGIAEQLAADLKDDPFAILRNDRYIVLVSDKYGVATVVAERDAAIAHKSALEIAKTANVMGISVHVHPFIVSDKPDGDGDIYVRPGALSLDISRAMAVKSAAGRPISNEDANKLVDFLNGRIAQSKAKERERVDMPAVTPEFKRLLDACARKALGDVKPWVAGMKISMDHLTSENFMLGPLLYAASEQWTAPYLASKRQGGFSFSIAKSDKDTILGYKVTGLMMASPAVVLLAVSAMLRKAKKNGECVLDPYLLRFADFIAEISGSADIFGDVDTILIGTQ
jgi:hypothetical protein